MRMLVEGEDDQTAADPSLLRVIVARAHDIQGRLSQNTDLTVQDIACEERVTAAYIYTLLRLPWLAPDITTAIVNGRQPQQLSAKTLMRKASRFPADWTQQRTLLGFSKNLGQKVRSTLAHPYDRSWTRHCSLDCNKKVNHEMPPERFSPSLGRDTARTSSLPQIGLVCASRTGAKMATKSTPSRE